MRKKKVSLKTIIFLLLIANVFTQTVSLKTVTKNNIHYFSAQEFIQKNNLKSTYYEAKEKLEIIYERNKIYFSPKSSFCRINETSYHLLYPTILINNKLYIPAQTFQKIINQTHLSMQIIEVNKEKVVFSMNVYNIHDFDVDKKENGVEILLYTTKQFPEKNIAISIDSNSWLNITILDSKIDSLGFASSRVVEPISKVKTIQSKNSSQISFFLKQKVDDIVVNSTYKSIHILLSIEQNEHAQKIQKTRNKKPYNIIVLDAGHGGKDPGAIGINKLQEKEVTLDIALQLTRMLERNPKFKVINTRDEDVFIPLWKRTQIANNAEGDIFISIHANATNTESVIGFETFLLRVGKTGEAIEVAKRENSVIELEENKNQYAKLINEELIIATITQNDDMKESEALAATIQEKLSKKLTNSRDRGVKQAGFHVLVGASMPNVLVEVGFLSNLEEANNLKKYQYRRKIAAALYEAIISFDVSHE